MRFTHHAKNQLRLYRLTQDDARFVIATGRRDRDRRGNPRYLGGLEGRFVRVVVAEDDPNLVITIYETKRP